MVLFYLLSGSYNCSWQGSWFYKTIVSRIEVEISGIVLWGRCGVTDKVLTVGFSC